MKIKSLLPVLGLAVLVSCGQKGPDQGVEKKVEETLSQMTLSEKIALIHAQSKFSSPGVPRLGVPELWTDDGPHGVRPEVFWDKWTSAGWTSDSCTAYPSLTCLAASWDKDLALLYGRSVGEEARYRKKNVLLGPGVNICRTPLCGRNFEYMGEDPFLAGKMAEQYVRGVQSNNVAVCVKHYAVNNQEFERQRINVNVGDRALYEIYLPAFKSALVDGGGWSVMAAYNKYDNRYLAENPRLLKDILKGEWGWDGAVISDWGAAHTTEGCAEGGLDLEFGSHTNGVDYSAPNAYDKYCMAGRYKDKIVAGELPESELNDKVRRALRLNFRTLMGGEAGFGSFASPQHFADCRKIGSEGIVLLRNEGGILPMRRDARKIVVLGENAIRPMVVGGSSSSLKTHHETSPLDGIRAAFPDAEVVYERTYQSDITTPGRGNYNYSLYDIADPRSDAELLSDALAALDGADYVLFIGGLNKLVGQDCEGSDRASYGLPYGQDAIIDTLASVRPDLIYVNISGTPVAMPFAGKVPAILQAWYLGSETGAALADVLTGDVCPSGKLPFTFPVSLSDGPLQTERQYPGIKDEQGRWQEYYDEGIYVGYRWYDTKGGEVQWEFGYGLSYTTFEFGKVTVSARTLRGAGCMPVGGGAAAVAGGAAGDAAGRSAADADAVGGAVAGGAGSVVVADSGDGTAGDATRRKNGVKAASKGGSITFRIPVTNTGAVAGAEVVQLYISDDSASVDRPAKELKGFQKLWLQPGETRIAEITISRDDLAFFDPARHAWVAEAGTFTALIGASSRDIRASVPFRLR